MKMLASLRQDDIKSLVDGLNFAQKVDRSLGLIREAYEEYGDRLVVANSLGKDSMAVWHLAKLVSPDISGFIVTTRFKPRETVDFMHKIVSLYPELRIFKNLKENAAAGRNIGIRNAKGEYVAVIDSHLVAE